MIWEDQRLLKRIIKVNIKSKFIEEGQIILPQNFNNDHEFKYIDFMNALEDYN